MPIDRLDFDNLAENDLVELVDTQVPEGLRIDYKRDTYGSKDSDKREFLKDVSSFANAFGGHLVIGIDELNGLPVAIPGISNVSREDELLRMGQLIRSGIEPPIQGHRVCAIPLATGAYCFVLRIPRSWYPPHRVSAQYSNRFWIRNSSGAHEASVEELRTMFTLGADAFQRVYHFRDERLREIISGGGARPLQGDGRLILHIVPLAAVASSFQVDLRQVEKLKNVFQPLGNTAISPRFNFEGFINERPGVLNNGYTQIFRNGAVEATKASIIGGSKESGRLILAKKFEGDIFNALPGYVNGLRDACVPPPLVVLLTLEGVKGIPYRPHSGTLDDPPPVIERDVLRLPECVVNEYGPDADYHRAVKPAFDALWNTTGRAKAETFSDDGVWRGDTQR